MIRPAVFAFCLLGTPAWAEMAEVTGSAAYLQRIALPPGAELVVELLDVSLQDAPAKQMSLQRLALTSVPQSFSLSYDPALIDERMSYTVSARVELKGKLLFRNTSAYPVLTREAGSHVEIVMDMIAQAPARDLTGTSWRATEIEGKTYEGERPPELFFDEGRVGVATGCNRFNGPVEIKEGSLRFSDQMTGTLMACPPPMDLQERAVLDAIAMVRSYLIEDGELSLIGEGGTVLIKLTQLP